MIRPSTFSIVAYDLDENAWGVAVASKFLAVGAVVPWARAGQGAVATQAYANTSYGPKALALMGSGLSAQETLNRLLADDDGRDQRQVGLVDMQGRAAAYTGSACYDWAGHIVGPHFTCQGNILVSQATVQAMADTFSSAKGELAERLVKALAAGEEAGGDSRGRQSAAVLVVKPEGGYAGFNDRYLDLRVDDNPQPVQRLAELLRLHQLYFQHSPVKDRIKIQGKVLREIKQMLANQNLLAASESASSDEYDNGTRQAFEQLIGRENLEDRCNPAKGWIDPPALDYLRQHFLS